LRKILVLRKENVTSIQAHGTALRNLQNQVTGAVIVMNDVTRLLRLENVRRDLLPTFHTSLKPLLLP